MEKHCQEGSGSAGWPMVDERRARQEKAQKNSRPDRRVVGNRGGLAGRHERHQRSARAERGDEKGGRPSGGPASERS